jgi:predicted nuclease of predicted toxin-antitoxin system
LRFLVDASLPRQIASRLIELNHHASDVRNIGMAEARDFRIAQHAREHELVLLSADFDFADVRVYPPESYPGIVVVHSPKNLHTASLVKLVEGFIEHIAGGPTLAGRLAIVEPSGIQFRPPLR